VCQSRLESLELDEQRVGNFIVACVCSLIS
jgi:hypothetical protein